MISYRLAVALILGIQLSSASGQNRLSFPDTTPSFCNAFLINAAQISGSRSYVRLKFELEALEAAQASHIAFQKTIVDMKSTDPTLVFGAILTGEKDSRDALNCAAIVMDRYKPENKDDDLVRVVTATAFLREREADGGLFESTKQRVLQIGSKFTKQKELTRAQHLTKLSSAKKDAANDLMLTTQASLMNAMDTSGPGSEQVKDMLLSCSERRDLIESARDLAKSDESAYQEAADLIVYALQRYGCKT